MNLSQLRTLIAVAEAGSFTAAAEATGITQSGMSQAIAALEESLGARLLVRQRHGVELTAFGERALHHARAALGHLESLRQKAQAASGEETGSLRIAAFPSVLATVLPPLLRRFRTRHPGIDVIALETDDREVKAWLAAGSIDLGVVLDPAPDSDAVPIGQDAWVAVLPRSHPLARQPALTLAQLAAEPFVLATGGCHLHAGTLAHAAGLSLADIRMEVRDWVSAVALVREGVGVGIVPESMLSERRKGLRVAGLDPPLCRRFGLMAAHGRACSRAARLFLELARKEG
ncbi:LysR family transcriptional regulator [Methylorubrum thiocyanatum]|uniref:LysR family transcriptional regulator n=1 Tax=Methylorubrum thiocyanatum TaxID=47958 RepID=UPI00383A959B